MFSLLGKLRGPRGLSPTEAAEASRRIRRHLDSERIVRALAEEIRRALGARHASVWLTTGRAEPTLAVSSGLPSFIDGEAPDLVFRASHRSKPIQRRGSRTGEVDIAAPIRAPQSGLIGVVLAEGVVSGDHQLRFVTDLATEAGFALETANLYEQAVADREKSDAVLGRVADAVVITDGRGRIREWNTAAERTFEQPPARTVGRSCAAVLGLHVGERSLDCTSGCALLGTVAEETALGQEVWRSRDDQRKQPLLASVSAVTDGDGNVSEVIHSFRDVTRLKEADEAKTMFLATASHELKTPLTVIQGFAQLLTNSRYTSEDERAMALEAIERRAIQLNRIVERLLLSSRIEAGRVEVLGRPMELEPILSEQVEAFRVATARNITLEIAQDVAAANADPDAVVTIQDHLLDNAMKYSPGGEPITVAIGSDETRVWFSVADGGIGMNDEQRARCFEKFWQAESTDVRRFGGTGIGLYIVRSLAEAMDGRVEVDSAPGAGATFVVSLPRADAPKAPPPASVVPNEERGMGDPSMVREFMRQIGIPDRRQP